MVKRLQKSALVTVLIALCLLLALAMVVAFAPSARVQAEDGTTATKYITADGTLSDTAGEGSIAVDVDADGTLVFNRIEQFNAVENTDVAGATTYTLKPYGYNYNGGLIIYPALKGQIVKYIASQSTTDEKPQ